MKDAIEIVKFHLYNGFNCQIKDALLEFLQVVVKKPLLILHKKCPKCGTLVLRLR